MSWKIFRLYDMAAHEIVKDLILYEQSYVLNELLRANESLWDTIANKEEYDEVFEWWLVTPCMAELLKENGEVIFADYDCYWGGERTTAGQALWMDHVIQTIAEEMSV